MMTGDWLAARETWLAIDRIDSKTDETKRSKEARAEAQKLATDLGDKMPSVTIALKGAPDSFSITVTLDDVDIPFSTLQVARKVNPGKHVVVVHVENDARRTEFSIAARESKPIEVDLTPAIKPAETPKPAPKNESTEPTTPTEPAPDSSASPLGETPTKVAESPSPTASGGSTNWPSALFLGLGAAAIVGGGITGVIALTDNSKLQTDCPNHVCPSQFAGELSDTKTMAWASTISLGVGGAALLVGLILAATHSESPPKAASIQPWIGVGSFGVLGRF
jgi:hypothetical protein